MNDPQTIEHRLLPAELAIIRQLDDRRTAALGDPGLRPCLRMGDIDVACPAAFVFGLERKGIVHLDHHAYVSLCLDAGRVAQLDDQGAK